MNVNLTRIAALTVVLSAMGATAHADGACCSAKEKKKAPSADAAFMAEAQKMMIASEGKKECCRSTEVKPVAKGEKGCCEAKGEPRLFKVFVAGKGYQFFGCEGSAGKGRSELVAKGAKVGPVQKVSHKA